MESVKKIVLTEEATATGGRDGHVTSKSGMIDLNTKMPTSEGWETGKFTNPEELFASCYATCFDGALHAVADSKSMSVDCKTTVKVHFGKTQNGFGISAHIIADINGVDQAQAQELLEAAHQVCPYSKATRGNIEVTISLA